MNKSLKNKIGKAIASIDYFLFGNYPTPSARAANKLYVEGTKIAIQANEMSSEDADILFAASYDKFQQALAHKSDYAEVYYYWGCCINMQAEQKSGDEASKLYQESREKYQNALVHQPDYFDALYLWGHNLLSQAKQRSDETTFIFYSQAEDVFTRALTLKDDHSKCIDGLGSALVNLSRCKTADDAENLIQQGIEKYMAAENLTPGCSSYNLACVASLQGSREDCREWLERCILYGMLYTRKQFEEDHDFDNVRGEPWFAEILAKAE